MIARVIVVVKIVLLVARHSKEPSIINPIPEKWRWMRRGFFCLSTIKGYCLQCFPNSPPGENVNSFTTWWMIYLTREYLIIHLVVKVLTFSPDGESYMLTIHLKVNCFHRSVKSRRSSSYCFVDWRGFIIHPEVN